MSITIEESIKITYLSNLERTVDYGKGPRPKVRYPKQYQQFDVAELTKDDVWLSSDLHFGHKNIIKYAERPFEDKFQMDDEIIRLHNETVGEDDNILFLGDIAFLNDTKASAIVARLNGEKELVIGNHDMQKKKPKELGIENVHLAMFKECEDFIMIFTHFPIEVQFLKQYRFVKGKPNINVHGHTHNKEEESVYHINVSVEHIGYKPIHLSEIEQKAKSRILEIEG